jgi:hypothetical protein
MTRLSALLLAVIAALFFAECSTPQRPEATKTVTVSASPSQPAISSPSAPPTTKPPLQRGPHSFVADIDLPQGTVQDAERYPETVRAETWHYSAPYDDTVAFLRDQFATGRRYDAHGATWWKGLPPCYYEHQSPLWGWSGVDDAGKPMTRWDWADGVNWLEVVISAPGGDKPLGMIIISEASDPKIAQSSYCLRV